MTELMKRPEITETFRELYEQYPVVGSRDLESALGFWGNLVISKPHGTVEMLRRFHYLIAWARSPQVADAYVKELEPWVLFWFLIREMRQTFTLEDPS